MKIKVNLRRLNKRWYMSVGTKGYACTGSFEKFLNEVEPSCVYISDVPSDDPLYTVEVIPTDEDMITLFKCGDNTHEIKQCPKMFKDLDLPTKFYINGGNS